MTNQSEPKPQDPKPPKLSVPPAFMTRPDKSEIDRQNLLLYLLYSELWPEEYAKLNPPSFGDGAKLEPTPDQEYHARLAAFCRYCERRFRVTFNAPPPRDAAAWHRLFLEYAEKRDAKHEPAPDQDYQAQLTDFFRACETRYRVTFNAPPLRDAAGWHRLFLEYAEKRDAEHGKPTPPPVADGAEREPTPSQEYHARLAVFFRECERKYRNAFDEAAPHNAAAWQGLVFEYCGSTTEELTPEFVADTLAPRMARHVRRTAINPTKAQPVNQSEKSTAESKTESEKKSSANRSPQNPDITALACYINRERKRGRKEPQTYLAREFTEGNEKLAQNLLRQLRSFPHLLNESERNGK